MFKLNLSWKNIGVAASIIKIKREYLLLILLIVVIFFCFLLPADIKRIKTLNQERIIKRDELNRKKTEFFSMEGILKDPQRYEDEYIQAEGALGSLEGKIGELKNALVKKELLAEVLNYLTAPVDPREAEFNLITMAPLVKQEHFNLLPIKMKINTAYRVLLDYINSLESLPILVSIKHLRLSSPEANGIINAEADLVIYISL